MTKKNISRKVSKNLNISSVDSSRVVKFFLNSIKKNILSRDVKLSEFGTFYKHKTAKRLGRNPKTKESYIIPAGLKVNFRASKKIKEVLN
tara:strand:+ start:703 stop:972 length:270 start_codon:yes stop_codon:yes gene_type:complete